MAVTLCSCLCGQTKQEDRKERERGRREEGEEREREFFCYFFSSDVRLPWASSEVWSRGTSKSIVCVCWRSKDSLRCCSSCTFHTYTPPFFESRSLTALKFAKCTRPARACGLQGCFLPPQHGELQAHSTMPGFVVVLKYFINVGSGD